MLKFVPIYSIISQLECKLHEMVLKINVSRIKHLCKSFLEGEISSWPGPENSLKRCSPVLRCMCQKYNFLSGKENLCIIFI